MKIYKYFNANRGFNFLQAPLIRVTNPHLLNDPFEFALTSEISKNIGSILEEDGGRKLAFRQYLDHFTSYGILSFTKTHDNLLMWSHYADEHKGIVVEFDIPDNDPNSIFHLYKSKQNHLIHSQMIDYKKKRVYDGDVNKGTINEIKKHYLFSKSDEWIYEKEFRFGIDYRLCDFVKVKKDHLEKIFEISYPEESLKDFLDKDEVKYEDDYIWIEIAPDIIKIDLLAQLWRMSNGENAFFFKLIDKEKISKVYLGCRCEPYDLDDALDVIGGQFNMRDGNNYINVYKATIDNEMYNLNFNNYCGWLLSKLT